MSATTTASKVHSTATVTISESVSIPIEDSECSVHASVDADCTAPIDNDSSAVASAASTSVEGIPTPARVLLPSDESAIITEVIDLATAQLESPKFKIYTMDGNRCHAFGSTSYSPLSAEKIDEVLGSQGVYRTRDGSFEYEGSDKTIEVKSVVHRLINDIIKGYIQAYFDSTPLKSDYEAFSKDDLFSSNIDEMLRALLTFSCLNSIQSRVVRVLGTLGYHLHNKAVVLNKRLFVRNPLLGGYIIALCTTDLVEKLDTITRQKSAHMIMLLYSTSTPALIQLFVKNRTDRYMLPVEYQKCYKVDRHSETSPGHVDFYKHSFDPQSMAESSMAESSMENPHRVGHWIMFKGELLKLTFVSSLCNGCDICNRAGHPVNSSDPGYKKMLSLVPERGIFKLYTDWYLVMFYGVLIGTIATAVSMIAKYRSDGVDPGGLIGTIVLVIIASIGFVRELFYPETELRDFLRAKVAISKFSKYRKQKGVCGSCVAALAVKNNADFGPVAVGPYASIAGGRPGPAERGKIFMDEPCDIKCFYAAGFAFARRIEVFSNGFHFNRDDGNTRIARMEWPSVFEQLVEYESSAHYFTTSPTDRFVVGVDDNNDHNVTTLVYGVATIKSDHIVRVEWLPIPISAVVGHLC